MTDQTPEERATWYVKLHIANDQGLCNGAEHIARETYADWDVAEGLEDFYAADPRRAEQSRVQDVAEAMQDWIEDLLADDGGDAPALLRSDLLGYVLALVDWRDVAEASLPEDADERAELLSCPSRCESCKGDISEYAPGETLCVWCAGDES